MDDLAAAEQRAEQAATEAAAVRAAAQAEYERLQAERRDREQHVRRAGLADLRDRVLPAARIERDKADDAVAAVLRTDPLGSALLAAVHASARYFQLQNFANGLAGAVGEPQREVSPMDAVLPDPSAVLTRVVQRVAQDSVVAEMAATNAALEDAVIGDGDIPAAPVVDVVAQGFNERRRAYQDHRLITLLGYDEHRVRQLSEAERMTELDRAAQREADLQEQQRQLFAENRSPRDKVPGSGFRVIR